MNACIVGYGAVGPVHAAAVSKTDGGSVYAVCDVNLERARACADEYGCLIYGDFDEMLSDSAVDVIHICTPHYLHMEMAAKALGAGKHVVLEKPVVICPSDMDELVSLADDAKGKMCVVLQNRANACIKALKEISEREKTGKLKGMIGGVYWKRDADYYAKDVWRGKWATEGGGALINQSLHMLDMMIYFGGKVKDLSSTMNHWRVSGIEVEDDVHAIIDFEGGCRGLFNATNCYVTNEPYYLELLFENAHYRYADEKLYRIEADGSSVIAKDEHVLVGKAYWGNGHAQLIGSFYDALGGKDAAYTNIHDAYETMAAVFKIYDNARNIRG